MVDHIHAAHIGKIGGKYRANIKKTAVEIGADFINYSYGNVWWEMSRELRSEDTISFFNISVFVNP